MIRPQGVKMQRLHLDLALAAQLLDCASVAVHAGLPVSGERATGPAAQLQCKPSSDQEGEGGHERQPSGQVLAAR